jgi:ATP-dependent protease ClpP protease subunit
MFFDNSVSIPTRTIYLGTESRDNDGAENGVEYEMSQRAIKALYLLDRSKGTITILHNTCGGDDNHMWAIHDAIKECRNKVVVKIYGAVHSAGMVILQAADERVLTPNCRGMIHLGSLGETSKVEGGILDTMYREALLDRIQEKNAHFDPEVLDQMLSTDTYFSATEMINLGLADRIDYPPRRRRQLPRKSTRKKLKKA